MRGGQMGEAWVLRFGRQEVIYPGRRFQNCLVEMKVRPYSPLLKKRGRTRGPPVQDSSCVVLRRLADRPGIAQDGTEGGGPVGVGGEDVEGEGLVEGDAVLDGGEEVDQHEVSAGVGLN